MKELEIRLTNKNNLKNFIHRFDIETFIEMLENHPEFILDIINQMIKNVESEKVYVDDFILPIQLNKL